MKKKLISGLIIAGGLIFLIIALLGYAVTSLWFMWGMVQSAPIVITLKSSDPLVNQLNQLGQYVPTFAPLTPLLGSSKTFLYAQDSQNEIFIAQPNWGQKEELQNQLSSQGFSSQTMWPFLIAQKGQSGALLSGQSTLSILTHGVLSVAKQIIKNQAPGHPVAVASIQKEAIPSIESNIQLIAAYKKEKLEVHLVTPETNEPTLQEVSSLKNQTIPASLENQETTTFFAIPSQVLAYIPNNLKQSLQTEIKNNLFLAHTTPTQLFSSFKDKDSELIAFKQGSNVALGIKTNPQLFTTLIRQLIEQEEGYNYPKRHAFMLPDKTLGYELIPQKPPVNWTEIGSGCSTFIGKDHQWYLCQTSSTTFIGTSQSVIEKAVIYSQDTRWQVSFSITNSAQEHTSFDGLTIHAFGEKNYATIVVNK